MESNSMSGAQRPFYLPASSPEQAVRGRLVGFVTALLRDHSRLVRSPVETAPIREFYLPATPIGQPGRLERYLMARWHDNRSAGLVGPSAEPVREFSLPAVRRH